MEKHGPDKPSRSRPRRHAAPPFCCPHTLEFSAQGYLGEVKFELPAGLLAHQEESSLDEHRPDAVVVMTSLDLRFRLRTSNFVLFLFD